MNDLQYRFYHIYATACGPENMRISKKVLFPVRSIYLRYSFRRDRYLQWIEFQFPKGRFLGVDLYRNMERPKNLVETQL